MSDKSSQQHQYEEILDSSLSLTEGTSAHPLLNCSVLLQIPSSSNVDLPAQVFQLQMEVTLTMQAGDEKAAAAELVMVAWLKVAGAEADARVKMVYAKMKVAEAEADARVKVAEAKAEAKVKDLKISSFMSSVYQIYRSTTIGLTLHDTLHELVQRQILSSRVVDFIFNVFDEIINEKLIFRSIKEKQETCLSFKGHLLSYRSCDQVWTLLFDSLILTSTKRDSSWKMNLTNQNNKIKIISCPATKLTLSNSEQTTTDKDDSKIKSKSLKKFKSK
ncbi:unnamed protein product [Rotaria magnacalcarata]|uniref:Uncharacterized protein n=2 Tax=Rotaria magnacalcarata TaxID=392030 RepID=A0A816KP10_9BILA|nr:unnamed protein product [Rotaria magnacalcarata]CAF4137650.1 unnamed protein product [Rotaria magnacalcarata]